MSEPKHGLPGRVDINLDSESSFHHYFSRTDHAKYTSQSRLDGFTFVCAYACSLNELFSWHQTNSPGPLALYSLWPTLQYHTLWLKVFLSVMSVHVIPTVSSFSFTAEIHITVSKIKILTPFVFFLFCIIIFRPRSYFSTWLGVWKYWAFNLLQSAFTKWFSLRYTVWKQNHVFLNYSNLTYS